MKIRNNKKSRGFTLVEFLFVALSLTIFMVALMQITIGGMRAFNRGVIQTEMKHQMRTAVDRISTDLRQAVPESGAAWTPSRVETAAGESQILQFNRFKYQGETSIPRTLLITYELPRPGHFTAFTIGAYTYQVGNLTRTVYDNDSGTTISSTIIARNIVFRDNTGGGMDDKSYFQWALVPRTTDENNIDVMQINLKMARVFSGRVLRAEELDFSTQVAILTEEEMVASSNYVQKIFRFGAPSSLIDP